MRMPKHSQENGWLEMKGRAKRQWDTIKHRSKHQFDANKADADKEFNDLLMAKKERDDKQLIELKSILKGMSDDSTSEISS